MADDNETWPHHRPRTDQSIDGMVARVNRPRNGVRLRVNSRIIIVKGAATAMTEHTIVVISEAHPASHKPAIPDAGAGSAAAFPAAAMFGVVADIELMASEGSGMALRTT